MNEICRNCHFLSKSANNLLGSGGVSYFSLKQDEREEIKDKKLSLKGSYSLMCFMGVWDEGVDHIPVDKRYEDLNNTSRKNLCFFYPYKNGMILNTAKEMQKREHEYRQLKKSNRHTLIALCIAAAGLFINAVLGIISIFTKK